MLKKSELISDFFVLITLTKHGTRKFGPILIYNGIQQ
ncbi:MAG: hypothetical protein ACD_7C00502G0005 [uncultured bacterium]|nr:MAG: hypothetical protein ACD_7C00502G0005 [uncultured bacterium]